MALWLDLAAPYLALVALGVALAALGWGLRQSRQLRAVQARYAELTAGTSGGNLEAVLSAHLDNVRAASENAARAVEAAREAERQSRSHIQHVGLVRYNPFSHTGGDQSFVLALADHDGNGALVHSLHAREGTRVYAKPLAGWQSIYTLTDVEIEAIAKAHGLAPAEQSTGAKDNGEV